MRIIIDDDNHLVTVFDTIQHEGKDVEVTSEYVRRQPVLELADDVVVLKYHPRTGARFNVQVDDDVFEATVDANEGSQDVLAKIASQITLDDTPRVARVESEIGHIYKLHVEGGTIASVSGEDMEHEPMPARVEQALHRHIAGY